MPKLDAIADELAALAAVDDDLGRTPADLGVTPMPLEAGEPSGPLAPAGRQVLALEPLILALPLPRTLALAAAAAELIDVELPWETPEALHDLLEDGAGLPPEQATGVVDRAVDLLGAQLAVQPDRDAGLAEDATALAQLDVALAAAADRDTAALLRAADLTAATFPDLGSIDAVAAALADLGLHEAAVALRSAESSER